METTVPDEVSEHFSADVFAGFSGASRGGRKRSLGSSKGTRHMTSKDSLEPPRFPYSSLKERCFLSFAAGLGR